MSDYTLPCPRTFPDGTSVGAYKNQPAGQGRPIGAADSTGTVASGSVAFTGLVTNTAYIAWGLVDGVWRSLSFLPGADHTPDPSTDSDELALAIGAEATIRAAADSAEATTRASADSTEATTRASADTTEATARAAVSSALTTHAALTTGAHGLTGDGANVVYTDDSRLNFIGQLNGATSVGASTVTLAAAPYTTAGFLLIQPASTSCELRRITTTSNAGKTLTLDRALEIAHVDTTKVWLVQGSSFAASVFGAAGDGTTDDRAALQQAIRQLIAQNLGLWLDGESKNYQVGAPLLLGPATHIRAARFRPVNTFPASTSNAVLMNHQLAAKSFTALASTDTFTTTAAHGLTVGNLIMFTPGTAVLPGGVSMGTVYYVKSVPTTTTFTISATFGGSTLDVTADGGGYAYGAVLGFQRVYFEDVRVDGLNVAGVNGAFLKLQQPASINTFRIDACPGTGFLLGGQQAHFTNVEIINCGVGLALDSAEFMYMFTLNIEQCVLPIWGLSQTDSIIAANATSAGIKNCIIHGFHAENAQSKTTNLVRVEGPCSEFEVSNLYTSIFSRYFKATAVDDTFTTYISDGVTTTTHGLTVGQKIAFSTTATAGFGSLPGGVTADTIYYVTSIPTTSTFTISATSGGSTLDVTVDGGGCIGGGMFYFSGTEATQGYTLRNIQWAGSNDRAFIYDAGRSVRVGAFSDLRGNLEEFHAPVPTASTSTYTDAMRTVYWRRNGGRTVIGGTSRGVPHVALYPNSDQTANQLEAYSIAGALSAGFTKNGRAFISSNTAPADGDVSTNQAILWFDSTAGAAKLMVKAKNSSGTVVTGSVTLT